MAGIQLAWHRLVNERTSKTPNTQPHTPSSSSRMKLYSGHNARHGPRHLQTGKLKSNIKFFFFLIGFDLDSLKHTPVSDDIRVRGAGFVAPLSPQVELAYHPIQLHLDTHTQHDVVSSQPLHVKGSFCQFNASKMLKSEWISSRGMPPF